MKISQKSLIIPFVLSTLFVFSQSNNTDSLKNLLIQLPVDTSIVDVLNRISYALFMSAPDSAIKYGNQAKEISEKIDYPAGLAYALKNVGLGYYMKGEFLEVLDYWNNSLEVYRSMNNLRGEANILNNLGAIYYNQGDDAKAIDLYLHSLAVSEKVKDTLRIATALINIGGVYYNKTTTRNQALDYYLRAIPLGERLRDNGVIGTASLNIGDLYLSQGKDSLALIYLEKSGKALEGTSKYPNTLSKIGDVYADQGEYDRAIQIQKEAIRIAREFDAKLEITRSLLSLAKTYEKLGETGNSLETYQEAKKMAEEIGSNYELKDAYEGISDSYANLSDYMNAYKYQKLLLEIKDTLFNIETDDKIKGLQFTYEITKKQGEIDLLTKDKALQEMVLQKQRAVKNTFLIGLILILIIAFITFRNYMAKVRTNRLLDLQKMEIEKLLMNILPAKVAKELREDGHASSRYFKSVSVLFTDFKDFSKISADLSPNQLVKELNEFFNAFDEIIEKNNLEKIKTIGDAYMCVGGLPSINNTHPLNAVNAGLEMQAFMEIFNAKRIAEGLIPWYLRVGVHTGPVTAGVVGSKKYAYDIWGSTVNVASRMESNGEIRKVNISSSTFELVKDNYDCTYRGKISAKNIGEVDMYFVAKKKVG